MAKVLVTGGAGFVGFSLVRSIIRNGHRILIVDDLSTGRREHIKGLPENVEFRKCDITDVQELHQIVKRFKPEVIIHLAAIHFIPYCNSHPERTFEVNVMGTRNLLEISKTLKPYFFFYASSAAVYPVKNGPLSENIPPEPIDIYGKTKLIGEELVRLYHQDTGLKAVIGRFFNIYGNNETNPHVIPEILNQLKGSKRLCLGNLSPRRDYIHVSDVVRAVISIIEKYKGDFDVFNIGTGREYSVKDIVNICEEILGEEIKIKQDKSRVRRVERLHLLADIRKIKKIIGWTPEIDFKDGLKSLLDYNR